MNRKTGKIILNLILVIALLVSIIGILIMVFAGFWLHTYKVFTQKVLVAELEVSTLAIEDGKKSFQVNYREKKTPTALSVVVSGFRVSDEFEDDQVFIMQGDEVRVGGQVVKFNDVLNLLGFKTIYKVTRIEGAYLDVSEEKQQGRSIEELNGGVDEFFKFIQANESSFSFFIDTAMGDYPGKNVQRTPVKYGLFVTEEGFLLDRL